MPVATSINLLLGQLLSDRIAKQLCNQQLYNLVKMPAIRFFIQADNQAVSTQAKTKHLKQPALLMGYVSDTGKLVLPTKTIQATSDLGSALAMKVGRQAGKRKLAVLYLIPTDEQDTDEQDSEGFPAVVTSSGVTIELAQILTGGRINYKAEKYSFSLRPFTY